MHQGNLFVTRKAPDRVDFASWPPRFQRAALSRGILYGFIKRDYRRVAEVHFEAGYVPRCTRSRISRRRSGDRRADPFPHRRSDFHGQALDPAFEITGLFDMKTRIELVLLQKTCRRRRRGPHARSKTRCVDNVERWLAPGSSRILAPLEIAGCGRAAATLARFASNLPGVLLRGENIVNQLEAWPKTVSSYPNRRCRKSAKRKRVVPLGHIALCSLRRSSVDAVSLTAKRFAAAVISCHSHLPPSMAQTISKSGRRDEGARSWLSPH